MFGLSLGPFPLCLGPFPFGCVFFWVLIGFSLVSSELDEDPTDCLGFCRFVAFGLSLLRVREAGGAENAMSKRLNSSAASAGGKSRWVEEASTFVPGSTDMIVVMGGGALRTRVECETNTLLNSGDGFVDEAYWSFDSKFSIV